MADERNESEPPFHLLLEEDEVRIATTALNLLISDERHEPPIRPLAREVLSGWKDPPDEHGIVSVSLTPPQMKITHTAVKVLFDDLQRGQADEREAFRRILGQASRRAHMRAIESTSAAQSPLANSTTAFCAPGRARAAAGPMIRRQIGARAPSM